MIPSKAFKWLNYSNFEQFTFWDILWYNRVNKSHSKFQPPWQSESAREEVELFFSV